MSPEQREACRRGGRSRCAHISRYAAIWAAYSQGTAPKVIAAAPSIWGAVALTDIAALERRLRTVYYAIAKQRRTSTPPPALQRSKLVDLPR